MNTALAFDPILPPAVVWTLASLLVLVALVAILARMRAAWLRASASLLLAAALFGPVLVREETERLPGIVALIVDESGSQSLGTRRTETSEAVDTVSARIEGLGEFELRTVRVRDDPQADGTAILPALSEAFDDVPAERIAGAVIVTDGIVHDVPAIEDDAAQALGFDAPVHTLVTGREDERDRAITLHRAPRYAILDEPQTLSYRVEDPSLALGTRLEVTLRVNGEAIATRRTGVGQTDDIDLPLDTAGRTVIELEVEAGDNELTLANNVAVAEIEVVRENLRVLLVSGAPHAGERTWRNILKSDAAVDLVHFTILRPPEKQDGTPIDELSLIAFPTRELFSEKIDEFDLIIFDRYRRRGVLPVLYLDNVAAYVRQGGAVLLAAGPDYASGGSLFRTPLSQVLPAVPTGAVIEEPYRAEVSETGKRHPVTRDLPGAASEPPDWSRWFRLVEADAISGAVTMTGPSRNPLLVLSREEEGRVAMFLSDHAWLWARGFEGGGPHGPLLRRLVHWLMKEPDLEEEALTATAEDGQLTLSRQTLADSVPPAQITTPDGAVREVALEKAAEGLWQARLSDLGTGLHRIANGDLTTLAHVGVPNPREFQTVRSTTERLAPMADSTGGSLRRLVEDRGVQVPQVRAIGARGSTHGGDWIGLRRSEATVLRGVDRLPLFAGILGLALLIGTFAALWHREGR